MAFAEVESPRPVLDEQASSRLERATDACERLPVLDRAVQRVLRVADDDAATTTDLVTTVESEPGLAANVLRYVNSAAAGRRVRTHTVHQAVVMVGRSGARRLALDATAYRFFERAPGNGSASRGQLHVHAVQVARLALRAAQVAGVPSEVPHMAALFHDCGKLVMPLAFGEAELDAIAEAHPHGRDRARAERRQLGADHAQAGAAFAAASGLSPSVVRAIAWHHGGDQGVECPDAETACVQLADIVARAVAGSPFDEVLCAAALETLGVDDLILDDLAEAALESPVPAGVERLQRRVADLERMAGTDDLTGIANRRRILDVLRGRLAAGATGQLMIVDVDHFKDVNDRHGHRAGDLLLMEVARLAAGVGEAGRLGGDEFVVWVDGDRDQGLSAAEELLAGVRAASGGDPVTLSIGIAAPAAGCELADALELADRALYEAKAGGRDRAVHAAAA